MQFNIVNITCLLQKSIGFSQMSIMKKIFFFFFPLADKENRQKKWYKQINYYAQTLLSLLILMWIVYIVTLPNLLKNTYKTGNIHIYSRQYINFDSIKSSIKSTNKILSKHGVDIDALHASIYLFDNDFLFFATMFPGLQIIYSKAGGYTVSNKIFIRHVGLLHSRYVVTWENKQAWDLSTVIAHEIVHRWQSKHYKLSLIPFLNITPKWVIEGFAVYATNDIQSRLKRKQSEKDFLMERNEKIADKIMRSDGAYALWGLMVKHAIEQMHYSVDDLHRGKVDYDTVYKDMMKYYKSK